MAGADCKLLPAAGDLVVARYQENLDWLTAVPSRFRVIVFNKGRLIESIAVLKRIDILIERDNALGRESDTYLAYLLGDAWQSAEWSIFTQGDPFSHSPDFLALLEHQERWAERQILTWQWLKETAVPPAHVLEREKQDFLGELRVRRELFSLSTLNAVAFDDGGALGFGGCYCDVHGLSKGSNIAAHFFALIGMPEIARAAETKELGRFGYGAIFAVRNKLIARVPRTVFAAVLELANSHFMYAYLLERLWPHIFGEPFLGLRVVAATAAGKHHAPADAATGAPPALSSL